MGPYQQRLAFAPLKGAKLRNIHCLQAKRFQTRELLFVMDYRAQRIEPAAIFGKMPLGRPYGPDDPSAESRIRVYLDTHHNMPNLP